MSAPTITVTPVDGALRVTIDGVCHDKPMTPGQMRGLALQLLHRAEEDEGCYAALVAAVFEQCEVVE